MPNPWPFPDKKNLAVITLRKILGRESPILLVGHDPEGSWQFLDGSGEPDPNDAAVVELEHMLNLDPSLAELADLPRGWLAWRDAPDAEWERGPHPNAESDSGEIDEEESPIIRHETRVKPFQPVFESDEETMTAVCAHFAEHIGESPTVYHELVSDLVHIDVHQIPPSEDHPYWTLFTTGMSDRPMCVPEGAEECKYAEVMIKLPEDWPMERLDDPPDDDAPEYVHAEYEQFYWPIRWLKILARLPHEYDTWLWYGHSVPNGDPPEPVAANTELCCMLLIPPLEAEPFGVVQVRPDKTVHILCVLALLPDEVELKLAEGTDALLEALEAADISDIVDIERPSAIES